MVLFFMPNTLFIRMENRRIYALGEIVYDIIFRNGQPVAARPGGAMLNSSVSLGRSGLPVSFAGTCGNDHVGRLIAGFLDENRVDKTFLHLENASTIIALAFLDENNNATYAFYKGAAPPESPPLPSPDKNDIVLFGSFYSVAEPTRAIAARLRDLANSSGSMIIYDPNFRSSHLRDLDAVKPFIEENIAKSVIVRGSDEDFLNIFGTGTADETWELPCFRNCAALVYTRSSEGVDLCTRSFAKHYEVPRIKPLSTIGAGDSFNAGIISALYESGIDAGNIGNCSQEVWDRTIGRGAEFSRAVCMSYDNYIPFP